MRQCASSNPWSGFIPARSAAFRCSSTRRECRPGRQSRSPPTRASRYGSIARTCRRPLRAVGRASAASSERAAHSAGLPKSRVREYVPYRMLEVEVAANAVYWWAAERILERRLPGERPGEAAEYAAAVRMEAQLLRHRAHDKLMKAFLGPEVFEGTVHVAPTPVAASEQL